MKFNCLILNTITLGFNTFLQALLQFNDAILEKTFHLDSSNGSAAPMTLLSYMPFSQLWFEFRIRKQVNIGGRQNQGLRGIMEEFKPTFSSSRYYNLRGVGRCVILKQQNTYFKLSPSFFFAILLIIWPLWRQSTMLIPVNRCHIVACRSCLLEFRCQRWVLVFPLHALKFCLGIRLLAYPGSWFFKKLFIYIIIQCTRVQQQLAAIWRSVVASFCRPYCSSS